MKDQKHIFAFYVPSLNNLNEETLTIRDKDLCHRLVRITRLSNNDKFVVFDRNEHFLLSIKHVAKSSIEARIIDRAVNSSFLPHVTLYLPLLKKDALSQAVYAAVEVGATEIQLLITEKSRDTISDSELNRLERVVIAAAEQSKYFAFPIIKKPIKFQADSECSIKIFFDPSGIRFHDLVKKINRTITNSFCLMVGPESDLTVREKDSLKKSGWFFCALTPTILRSVQSVPIALGIIRSFFRTD